MGRLTEQEIADKVAAVNRAIDELIESSKKTNLCTAPKVVALANEYLNEINPDYTPVSRDSIVKDEKKNPDKDPRWTEAHNRIKEHRDIWKKSGTKTEKRIKAIKDSSNELDELSRNQSSNLLSQAQMILKLRKEKVAMEKEMALKVKLIEEWEN